MPGPAHVRPPRPKVPTRARAEGGHFERIAAVNRSRRAWGALLINRDERVADVHDLPNTLRHFRVEGWY